MSFHSWLQNLRSALAPSPSQRKHRRRGSLRAATHRPILEVLEDRLTPSFSPITSYSVGTNPVAIVTADFNHDGRLDLATANYNDRNVSVRLGDGQGGFGAANEFGTGPAPRSLVAADFNNDGHPDLAVMNDIRNDWRLPTISLLMGAGDGTFLSPVDTYDWVTPLSAAAGDFNADGNLDLVYTIDYGLGDVEIEALLGNGQGGFVTGNWAALVDTVALAVADLNANGIPDVVTANYANTVTVLLDNDWPSYFDPGYTEFPTGQSPRAVAIGDFTGDGIPDAVTAGQTVDVLPGRGDGTFDNPISRSANTSGITTVAAADFNGDGKLDVVTADPTAGIVSVFLGNGNGALSAPFDHEAGSLPKAVAAGDFNGDGRTDVAAANASSNTVSVLLNDGAWSTPVPIPRISITDFAKSEGKKGQTTVFTFTVTLSAACDEPVTLSYRTVNGTATSGDYVAKTGTLAFAPGETTKTITIEVKGDNRKEANETFYLDLFDLSSNALFTKNRGIGTILNDD
jgi:hypothetical protein